MYRPLPLLVELPLRHDHFLESVQRGQDGASDPRRVEPLLRGRYFNLHVFRRKLLDFGEEPIAEALEQGGAPRQDYVLEENLPEIEVRLLYGVDENLVESFALLADQVRPEENFGGPEPRRPDLDHVAVGQGVVYVFGVDRFLFQRVIGQVAGLLLDGPDRLEFGRRPEIDALLAQQQPQVAGDVSAGDVDAHNTVWHGEALIDRHCVGHSITCIQNYARSPASGVSVGGNSQVSGPTTR
jgi:hypothetical protein